MSGTFNSNTNTSQAEPSSHAQATTDLMDQPITPLPVTPLAPSPDSTEQPILSSSTDSTSDPNSQAFKPQVFRRKSSNYEMAAKRAASGEVPNPLTTAQIEDLVDSETKQKGPENTAEKNWEPKFERKQSWDQQDWKHDLQMAVAGSEKKAGEEEATGFTETGNGSGNKKRYSQS